MVHRRSFHLHLQQDSAHPAEVRWSVTRTLSAHGIGNRSALLANGVLEVETTGGTPLETALILVKMAAAVLDEHLAHPAGG